MDNENGEAASCAAVRPMTEAQMEEHRAFLVGIGVSADDADKVVQFLQDRQSGEMFAYEPGVVGLLPGADIQAHVMAERRIMNGRSAMWMSFGAEGEASIWARIEHYTLMPIILDMRAHHGDGAAAAAAQAVRDHIRFLREFREKIGQNEGWTVSDSARPVNFTES